MIKFAILPGVLLAATVAQLVQSPMPVTPSITTPAQTTTTTTVSPAGAPTTTATTAATPIANSATLPAQLQSDIETAVTAALKAQIAQQQAAAAQQQQAAQVQHADSTSMTTMVISIVGFLTLVVQLAWKAYSDSQAARELASRQSGISQALESHQAIVLGKLNDASKAAESAYSEANNLNQKIHSLGLKLRENTAILTPAAAAASSDGAPVVTVTGGPLTGAMNVSGTLMASPMITVPVAAQAVADAK